MKHLARVELPGRPHAVVGSSPPLAREVSRGQSVPIDLSLRDRRARMQRGLRQQSETCLEMGRSLE